MNKTGLQNRDFGQMNLISTRIICIGGVTIDRKLRCSQPPQLGTSNPVSSNSSFGGVAHNVAANLSQLTDNIHIQSVVGDDQEGALIMANFKDKGIDTKDILVLRNQSTAHYDVILDQEGELYLALADMAIFDVIPFIPFFKPWQTWLADDLIFIDCNLPPSLLEMAVQMARIKKVRLCIDPVSVTKAKKLPGDLDSVFLLKPDRFEAESLTQMSIQSISDCYKAGRLLLDRGVEHCIISLGREGYVISNAAGQQHVPARVVNSILDVSGAGDAFVAGILYQLKQGASIEEACHLGEAAAALTLQSCYTVSRELRLDSLQAHLCKV